MFIERLMFVERLFLTVGPKRYVNYFIDIFLCFSFFFMIQLLFLIALILNCNCYLLNSGISLANYITILQQVYMS